MRLGWALILIIPVVVILGVETYALVTEGLTLSRFIWNIGQRWPLFIYLLGFVNGILAAHFFWPWDPRNSKSGG